MNCPLCREKLYAIGEQAFDKPVGYECPTKITMATIRDSEKGILYSTDISHYEIRGARTIINLPEDYRIITWSDPMESYGHSTILHYMSNGGYQSIFSCRELPIDSEDQLLKRIKLLAIFS